VSIIQPLSHVEWIKRIHALGEAFSIGQSRHERPDEEVGRDYSGSRNQRADQNRVLCEKRNRSAPILLMGIL